jgi:hypothetical protein
VFDSANQPPWTESPTLEVFFFAAGTKGGLPSAEPVSPRILGLTRLEHQLDAPDDFVEVVFADFRIRFAEIRPRVDVVHHQF